MIPLRPILLALPFLGACGSDEPESGTQDQVFDCSQCGDPDGTGTETGDIPNALGSWTSTFATQLYFDDCDGVSDLDQTSETWINGKAFSVGGYAPDGLTATFDDNEDEVFLGVVNGRGGIIFSGVHQHSAGTMYLSFGGQMFNDVWRDPVRDVIQGFAYLGLDTIGKGDITCSAWGNWFGIKSS